MQFETARLHSRTAIAYALNSQKRGFTLFPPLAPIIPPPENLQKIRTAADFRRCNPANPRLDRKAHNHYHVPSDFPFLS
jgi:hypothetical protein